ncbi:MAG: glycosyltransferase N-terminal domain-containing protein [Chitinophagales bacterium]
MLSILVYNVAIRFYYLVIYLATPFSHKAKLWIEGRKNWKDAFSRIDFGKGKRIWFHCASLGEFEQARPVIEEWKKSHSDDFIILTFFSPSGYEVRRSYQSADLIMYLPLDTHKNAHAFLEAVKPDIALFTKYEFWFHYLQELKARKITVILFSSVFRKEQVFFRWYGSFFRSMLGCFTKVFVQNIYSQQLLKTISIESEVCFDTRFDRVNNIMQRRKMFDSIEKFKGKRKLIVAGSTWMPDEELLVSLINESVLQECKFIIAPHNINQHSIDALVTRIKRQVIRFSEINDSNTHMADVVIVDNVGNLASLYAYAEVAYVGGGFNSSVHNVLEPAVYGIPVLFGPNHQKSEEAKDIVDYPIDDYFTFKHALDELIGDAEKRNTIGLKNKQYVQHRLGGSLRIVAYMNQIINPTIS